MTTQEPKGDINIKGVSLSTLLQPNTHHNNSDYVNGEKSYYIKYDKPVPYTEHLPSDEN